MQLDKHISYLLYKHNCVIVTDFGGFVTNYKSATIHPGQHTFSPPSKQVAFNRNLVTNDGLLANYVSQKLSVSYPEACRIISSFVEYCNAELESGKKIVFENIGELFYDMERNLQFVPHNEVNYLLDSFGLGSFQSPAIKRDERMIELAEVGKAIPSFTGKKKKSKLWRLVEIVPVAAVLTYFIINSSLTANLHSNLAGLNPFANTKTEKVETTLPTITDTKSEINVTAPENNVSEPAVVNNPPVNNKVEITPPITATVAEPAAVSKPETPEVKEENTPAPVAIKTITKPSITSSGNHSFYIVGGCFSVPENATNFVAQLKAEGYPALIVGKNSKGMDMVGIASASNRSKAEEMLGFIQESGYPDAWVFRKR